MRARQRVRSLLLIVFLLATLTMGSALAHPPDGTDHGVEPSVFKKLWSADEGTSPKSNSTTDVISASSDFSFLTPPEAPEDWNDGEFDEFGRQFDDSAGVEQKTYSIYPEDTNLTDADWIKDAYAQVFAVRPSTVVHLSDNRSELYVPTKGTVYSVVDFRVDLPDPNNPACSPRWKLNSYNIEFVKLLANGRLLKKGDLSSTTQKPVLSYSNLPRNANRLTFRAEINVRARKKTRNSAGSCTFGRITTKSATVNDSISVETYSLSGIARMARYPDGSSGVFAYQNSPWHGFSLPGGNRVYSNWRFFTARDTDWDDLTVSSTTPGGSKTSPARLHTHPLRVHAYPSKRGTFTVNRQGGESPKIVSTLGIEREAPELPENVEVDVVDGNYSLIYGFNVKFSGEPSGGGTQTNGLVRGVEAPPTTAGVETIRESNLTLSLVRSNVTHAVLEVSLRDNVTGEPIDTRARGGEVLVMGNRSVNTSGGGRTRITVPKLSGVITARYSPAGWWETERSYTADQDTLLVKNSVTSIDVLTILIRFVGVLIPFLVITYFVDRGFGLDVWPPWRGI